MLAMKRPDLSLILPCYNEEPHFKESVKRIVNTLKNSRLTFEIIFVDDRSRDNTSKLVEKACAIYRNCRAIYHQKNLGRGLTVTDGIKISRGKVVGYLDIDLEVSPVYITQAVAIILNKQADVVVGQRIYRTTFSSILREVLSRGYRQLAASLIDIGDLDTESGYKFFNRTKILPILAQTEHPHWFWDTEIIVFAKRAGLKIVGLPVLFLRRPDKKSTVRVLPDMVDYLISLWRLKRRLKKSDQ